MTRGRAALAGGLAAFAALTALSIAVRSGRTWQMDRRARRWMRRHQSAPATAAFSAITWAGVPPVHLPGALLAATWVHRRRGFGPAMPLALSSVAAFVAHHAIKSVFHSRRRPGAAVFGRHQPAFPSGHTTGATAVSLMIGYVLLREQLGAPRAVVPAAAGVPLMVGVSRSYLDRHWAADVLAGWLLGGGIAALCVAIYESGKQGRAEFTPGWKATGTAATAGGHGRSTPTRDETARR